MSNSTLIRFKRSTDNEIKNATENTLDFGEPLFINVTGDNYLVLGKNESSPGKQNSSVVDSVFFRGMTKDQAQNAVTYNSERVLVDLSNNKVEAGMIDSTNVVSLEDTTPLPENRYYIVCRDSAGNLYHFNVGDNGIYIDNRGVMHGAAWNDYAEGRTFSDDVVINDLAGRVVCEVGDGTLKLSRERLQPCAYVVSDTFGTTIGEGNINIAVAGKVLVYTDDQVELGDCVAAGFDGKAVKMTRQEIINYPDRILGVVVEVPTYTEYNGKDITGRVWVRVK